MSDFTPKNCNGLMEAYASIYQQPEFVVDQNVEEEICFEDLEVDNDLMVDLVVERLIVEGYANTEDQALNMIPHMSDAWLGNVVGNFVLEESFIDAVNSLLEEGYDLSSYTVDELFEYYIGQFNGCLTEDYRMVLQEAIPLLAAPLLANPATWAAATGLGAGAIYAGKKALDAWNQRRSGRWNQSAMDNIQWRDSKPTVKPVTTVKSQTRDVNLDRPGGSATYPGTGYEKGNVNLGSREQRSQAAKQRITGQSGGGEGKPPEKPPEGPTPPKPPKGPGPLGKAKDLLKQGLGLQPSQSIGKELVKKTIVKTGQAIKGTPGAVKGFFTSPKPAVRALKALGVAELGALAGRQGTSPTGATLKLGGDILKGAGGAVQNAPREASAAQQALDTYRRARQQAPASSTPPPSRVKW